MTAKYYAILTNQGAARLANAAALGTKVNLTQMAVGDANGVLPTPDPSQTALINRRRIAPINLLTVDPNNASQIIVEQIIPEDEGGWWIREIGLYDSDGVLIAVANCPETYKPQLQEGSGRTQTIRMILIVSSTAAVTLKIDPSVVLATRKYVEDNFVNRITVRGGKAGQVLAKRSNADEDFYWLDPVLKRGSLENVDLNTLGGPESEGVWYQAFDGSARPELNYPVQTAGVLTCTYSAYLGCQQRYETYVGDLYLRGRIGDWDVKKPQWTPWIKQARADSLGSVAKENIVPLSKGGTGATTADDARKNLALGRVEQRDNETIIYAGDDHTSYFAIRIDGRWGIYDPSQGFIPLGVQQGGTGARDAEEARENLGLGSVAVESIVPVSKGGTGAKTADDARKKLSLDRIEQRAGETVMFSDESKNKFMTARSDNTWGYYNDDLKTFIALPVSSGGTGALSASGARTNLGLGTVATENTVPVSKGGTGGTTAAAARTNLALDRIEQRANETVIFGDAFKDKYLTARTDNSWGYYNTSLGKFIPLPVVAGGTGANDAKTARDNLGLGDAAVGQVRTGVVSGAGDKLFSSPFSNQCTAIAFGVMIGQTWIFSPYVTYLSRTGFGFDGRCWSGFAGTDAQQFGESVYYIAWGN